MALTKSPSTSSYTLKKKKSRESMYGNNFKDPILDEDIFADISKTLEQYDLIKPRSKKNKVFAKLCSISVNFWDILGLLDICPCGTIHSIKPYISYN
ncbi:hypothetical protein Zmor_010328 [Zophobas morio]|uniref:Uncharacterized protein n=1 Tax=Zophobas morio TaxID=2755281 RepID=A0AA38MJR0_9CUCU|nr:hypothetical protein Zmor_010328 [Zophobas morio]